MMKLLIKIMFFFLILFHFCCNNNCSKEETFHRLFSKSLKGIKEYYETSDSGLSEKELNKYFFFIGKTTEHHSSRVAGNFGVIYQKKEDYQLDIGTWEKWYDLNKNSYNIKEVNEKFVQLPDNVKNGAKNWCEFLGL